jgi:FKBP-type peptidyl-prolyl cis-trans isomerase
VPPAGALTTPSGIAMKVLEPGAGSEYPSGDDCVVVIFTALEKRWLAVPTSGRRGESTAQCLASAIPGVAEALKSMLVGEKRRVWGTRAICGFSTKPITRSPLKPITHSPGKPISVLL